MEEVDSLSRAEVGELDSASGSEVEEVNSVSRAEVEEFDRASGSAV